MKFQIKDQFVAFQCWYWQCKLYSPWKTWPRSLTGAKYSPDGLLQLCTLLFFFLVPFSTAKLGEAIGWQKPQQEEQRAQATGEKTEVSSVCSPRPEAGARWGANGLVLRPSPAAAAAVPPPPDPEPAAATVQPPGCPAGHSEVRHRPAHIILDQIQMIIMTILKCKCSFCLYCWWIGLCF